MRILSLLPSATEIVYELGLGEQLVGVSHECDFPPEVKSKPVVSATELSSTLTSAETHGAVNAHQHPAHSLYRLDQDLLRQLAPDLILTQELCQVCAVPIGQVRQAARVLTGPCRIVSLEPTSLGGIMENILTVGEMTGTEQRARQVVQRLQHRMERVSALSGALTPPRVLCLEWMEPLIAGGHWIPEMVRLAGGTDGLGREGGASHVMTWQRVVQYAPEVVVLMPCGYSIPKTLSEVDRLRELPGWNELPAVRAGRVYAVESHACFSRPGPRIVTGLEILAEIMHPETFSNLIPAGSATKLDRPATPQRQ